MSDKNKNILIKPIDEFRSELDDRINLGKGFLSRKPSNLEELEELNLDFSDWEDINMEIIKYAFRDSNNEHFIKYKGLNSMMGLVDALNQNINTHHPSYKLELTKKKVKNSIRFLKKIQQKLSILPSTNEIEQYKTIRGNYTNKGFIVHGHNNSLKLEVARFIEKQLKKDAIILHEQANKGKTVIEKFENYSTVDFAIALWTNDDLGKAKANKNLQPRARQNVIFETGFFIGKIGREKVIILHENEIEIPSDYSGVVYIPLEGNWKEQLRIEIEEIYTE